MSTLAIVVLVVAAGLVLLAVGGAVATGRRARAQDDELFATIGAVNDALAAAHAADNGWNAARLDSAARAAFAQSHPGVDIQSLRLVHVHDLPGVERDEAVFRVVVDGGEHELILGREGDDWITRS